jgi:hypothetical protein
MPFAVDQRFDQHEGSMARKRKSASKPSAPRPAEAERPGVTAERFTRLYRLVRFLAAGPKPRDKVMRHLRLDVRGFYRDLELLRSAGITVQLAEGRYGLAGVLQEALLRLPFPDPHLTLGEAEQLARGRSRAHQRLREEIANVRP